MTLALFKVPNTNNFVTLEVILRSLRGQSAIFWRDQSCSLDKLWSTTKNRYLAQFQVPNTSRGQLQVLEVILRSFEGCFEVKVFFCKLKVVEWISHLKVVQRSRCKFFCKLKVVEWISCQIKKVSLQLYLKCHTHPDDISGLQGSF